MSEEKEKTSGWLHEWSMPLGVIGFALAVMLLVFAVKLGALLYGLVDGVDPEGDNAVEAIRGIGWLFGAIVGGIVAVVFGVWRGLIAEKQTVVARQQFERSQDRDYADLFTKAVEQLGATREVREYDEEAGREVYRLEPNIEVRLGAIYALERISQDSERDHIAVMETLCAYVRENASAAGCEDFSEYEFRVSGTLPTNNTISTDIQTILRVLGRRKDERIFYELNHKNGGMFRLDLSNANLRGADLRYCNFNYARFSNSRLEGSTLYGTNFDNAHFWKASLDIADLRKTSLNKADLIEVKIRGARFKETNLHLTNISLADFSFCDDLTTNDLDETFGCSGTVLPEAISNKRPQHWYNGGLFGWYERKKAHNQWLKSYEVGEPPPWIAEKDWTGW